jgi:hypothetical protein
VGDWWAVLLKFVVFWGKVVAFLFFYMWVRWTLPRFRFDQLMGLAWRGMIPVALGGFLLTATVVFLEKQIGLQHGRIWMLAGNVVLLGITLGIMARRPPRNPNRRVPVPGSRYNPQFNTVAETT